MKKLIILFVIPLFFGFKTGDEIDEKRMNRDLEIAKNILATLIKSNTDGWFGGSSIDASYIQGYGVVFTIPEHMVYFHHGGNLMVIPEMPPIPDVEADFDFEFENDFDFSEKEIAKAEKEMKKQKEIVKKHEKALKKQQYELQKHAEEMEIAKEEIERAKEEAEIALADGRNIYLSTGAHEVIDWEKIMVTFMTDYADLIGQLQANDKILIKQNAPYNDMVFIWSDGVSKEKINKESGNLSAEVLRKDISAYKSGKIKKDEFIDRIKINKKKIQKKIPDLEMFADIVDRFYSRDLSETFYSHSKPRYEVLDGFGVVFYIETSSGRRSSYNYRARSSGVNSFSYSVAPDTDESKDEELYLKFKEDIKSFMLDYGRTIRSLDADDKVMLNIKINSCRDCNVPKAIEVSTKMSVLKDYDMQKLSREKAENQIEIKEI